MNNLIKAVEILKEKFKHEIYEGDWSYNLTKWTIKIDTDDGINYNVVAYPVKDNQTQWDSMQFVRLPSYPVEFELTY